MSFIRSPWLHLRVLPRSFTTFRPKANSPKQVVTDKESNERKKGGFLLRVLLLQYCEFTDEIFPEFIGKRNLNSRKTL